ncbi:uncharacterized protein LOC127862565 [Dreissena polymorpha]|uniref:Reverse transcriptase n=1 Tax=Dreissena polymorpha TaxID=45954 RepID=A0A9D3Y775_DREPO|nr:uncharacterized protein LOC127862565 [Dreissena polymorpha]XP_052257703.1 uncharacterized protein LOC127862565 [Dreissena polymorpha]XP_052257705.1 uncharacterized protein LOC127862565 [Dreissena polymorpha]XP_052257706.1 uncharacterized protein LOC127862565 [Dreissena polymorpha]XP_052257707.1 uncharacterized protein LOC127862565 [Dreissena polymorpha]XP_052257708.1 uncharacterized protein LOC127862565 [Dreissena polymorpha]XP_052257709.1 uncharacterized protein LOC127862565 [Dreissena po
MVNLVVLELANIMKSLSLFKLSKLTGQNDDKMMDICYKYSRVWRYEYNASKCAVIVFNERTNTGNSRVFRLGSEIVKESESYSHLGITTDAWLSSQMLIADACNKLRGTYLSICSSGFNPSSLSPITLRTIYQSVVVPKALYGCELWTVIGASDMLRLERSHRFCIKSMQQFHSLTNTDFALASINVNSIENIIDRKKLVFFGQLCRLPNQYLAKQVFINRLVRYLNNDKQTKGFVPEIYRLLYKYQLQSCLDGYLQSGLFPSKQAWKQMLQRSVSAPEHHRQLESIRDVCPTLNLDDVLHVDKPSSLWKISRISPKLSPLIATLMAQLGGFLSRSYPTVCSLCGIHTENKLLHSVCFCSRRELLRDSLWDAVIYQKGSQCFIKLIRKTPLKQIVTLFQMTLSTTDDNRLNNQLAILLLRLVC